MKKRIWWIMLSGILVLAIGVGATVAYLVASSGAVENTFTVGNVAITLTETTGSTYKLLPGATLMKDPTVTVRKGSEACWLFVRVSNAPGFGAYASYEIQEGWTALPEQAGVYYREVEAAAVDRIFKVLKNDRVTVKDTVTEEQLEALQGRLTLVIDAGAIQLTGLNTAQEAWQALNM